MTLDRPSVPGKDPFTLCVHLCDFTAGEIVFHYRASSQQNSAERFFENIEWEQQTMIAACIWQYSSNQLLINWVLGPLSRSWKVPWEDNEVCYLPSCVVFHWILSTVFFFFFFGLMHTYWEVSAEITDDVSLLLTSRHAQFHLDGTYPRFKFIYVLYLNCPSCLGSWETGA